MKDYFEDYLKAYVDEVTKTYTIKEGLMRATERLSDNSKARILYYGIYQLVLKRPSLPKLLLKKYQWE